MIELSRASDGLILLRIPVVVTIAARSGDHGRLAAVDQMLAPYAIWRMPIELSTADEIVFDGVALDRGGNERHSLGLQIYDEFGRSVATQTTPLDDASTPLAFRSPRLPAGRYELLINRSFGRPAALGQIKLAGAFSRAKSRLIAGAADDQGLSLAVALRSRVDVHRAELALSSVRHIGLLQRGEGTRGRRGFVGAVNLSQKVSSLAIALGQSEIDRALESFLHVELVLVDADSGASLYRGWHDLRHPGSALEDIKLAEPAQSIQVLAYPNIVDWSQTFTGRLELALDEPLATPIQLTAGIASPGGSGERTMAIRFEGAVPRPASGVLQLWGEGDVLVDTMTVTIP